MAVHIDETLPSEEQGKILQRIAERAKRETYRMIYESAIKRGTSIEEAAKEAKAGENNFML